MPIFITLIGGPTALIEIDGFRLLTDPTFDAPGAYQLPHVKLEKTTGPALAPAAIGPIDAVLLSHDQHSDNLDNSGRALLGKVKRVLTTEAGAKRLGGHVEGLAPWDATQVRDRDGNTLTITATPARHGPAGIEPLSGDVIGFVVSSSRKDTRTVYISGDTTWFDGVADVARLSRCGDRAGAHRRLGAFPPERRGSAQDLRHPRLRPAPAAARARRADGDRGAVSHHFVARMERGAIRNNRVRA